ncbi:hypothetical protein AMEC673_02495 [Alteromonas macleodii str. 'English Channel 673']|jgi:hypothetical protein|uniref:Uncharacterized protein n=2 Tax=Alteromonas macleodii TaxID=28108 RepID=A0AB32ZUN9_ALTME|nr:hypothetical protein AMEC673_02495 [Alteromonas macleodii str. 'English Channel 673']
MIMTKLTTWIEVTDGAPELMLKKLAISKFGAERLLPVPETETINIDGGLNDIRAVINTNEIRFFVRYEREVDWYTRLISAFVQENSECCRLMTRENTP